MPVQREAVAGESDVVDRGSVEVDEPEHPATVSPTATTSARARRTAGLVFTPQCYPVFVARA